MEEVYWAQIQVASKTVAVDIDEILADNFESGYHDAKAGIKTPIFLFLEAALTKMIRQGTRDSVLAKNLNHSTQSEAFTNTVSKWMIIHPTNLNGKRWSQQRRNNHFQTRRTGNFHTPGEMRCREVSFFLITGVISK